MSKNRSLHPSPQVGNSVQVMSGKGKNGEGGQPPMPHEINNNCLQKKTILHNLSIIDRFVKLFGISVCYQ